MTATDLVPPLAAHPVVPVIRHRDGDVAEEIARACLDGGLRVVEITLTTPDALALLADLAGTAADGVLVGAGTVRDVHDARRALDAGATFLVSPVLDPDVVALGVAAGVTVVPGTFTPTEVARAARLGATMAKVFPAATLGTGFVRAVRTVLPDVPLLVSGGVTGDDVAAWRDAGATSVAIGGDLNAAHADGGPAAVAARAAAISAAHPHTSPARMHP